jgi:hypothetical protein
VETLNVFKEYSNKRLKNYPKIIYSNLYKKVLNNFCFEFYINKESYLFSPYYVLLRGGKHNELLDFVEKNEDFFDSLREFILNSLFVYSALIEENSYYLTKPQSIVIARMIHKEDYKFEVKFYAHYQDELLNSYNDKIYIGRDFLNLKNFERKYLGLKKYMLSLVEQNSKIQIRAKTKLRYFDDYKKPYLDEIEYLTNEAVSDSMERIKLFPEKKLKDISKVKSVEVLDNILHIINFMVELKDFTREFESKLRLREENNFVKYLTKYLKDLVDSIRYLTKLSIEIQLKISDYSIS